MGRSAIPLDTIWPNGSDPKTLVCVRAQCSVAELFNTVFGESDLSEQLHKQRGDTDLVESPWYPAKDDLPPQLFTWQVTDPPNKPSATLRHRKVRFESPPTALASKPFQNEESQVITELYPDTLYVVEAVSSTSAPYGDKFNVYFRYTLRAAHPAAATDGGPLAPVSSPAGSPSSSVLHIQFHVEWLPAMNRMMRPVVGKAVDGPRPPRPAVSPPLPPPPPPSPASQISLPLLFVYIYTHRVRRGTARLDTVLSAGVRSTFKIFRTVLGTLQSVADIRESEVPAGGLPAAVMTSHEVAVPARGGVLPGEVDGGAGPSAHNAPLHPQAAAAAGFAPGAGPSPDLLSVLTQQLVYKDQVVLLADLLGAGLRTVSASDLGAQLLAAALTIWLISIMVAALRSWKALCGGGGGGGGGGLLWPLRLTVCWPLALVDLPDSTAEVLTSLAMVAAINWAVICGSEAVVRFLSKKHPGLLAAARGGGGGGAGDGGRGGEVIGGVPFSQTPLLGTRGSSGAGGGGVGRGPSGGGAAAGVNHTQSSAATTSRGTGSAAAAPPPAAVSASVTAGGDGGGKDKGKAAFRWDAVKTSDLADVGSPDSASSPSFSAPSQQYHLTKLKARSEAGGALASDAAAVAAAAMAAAAARRRGSAAAVAGGGGGLHYSFTGGATAAPSMFSVQSDVPLLAFGEVEEEGYGGGSGGDEEGYYGETEPALVVEEVFENERFQPFRGWGHQWPGHFLPSDRVGHWSDRQGKPGGSASMVFEQVVPQLPRGWRWMEEDWQVDLEGLDIEAVDADGWTYALDFYLLKYPPPPQGGKCSLKHFVRRRRYFRTRVRIEGRSTRSSGDYTGPLAPPFTRVSGDGGNATEGGGAREGIAAISDSPTVAAPGTTDAAAAAAAAAVVDPLAATDPLLSLSDGIPSAPQPHPRPSRHPLEDMGASGGGGDGTAVELQPAAPSSTTSPTSLGGSGGGGKGLPRPRSASEGLSEVLALQEKQGQQGQQGQGTRSARSSSSSSGAAGGVAAAAAVAAPVQATLDLFNAGARTASAAAAAADGVAKQGVRQGGGDAVDGSGGGGRGAVQHGELFLLSPKTEVMSDDPLGALAAEEERGLTGSGKPSPPPPPPPPLPAPEPPAGVAEAAVVASGGDATAASGGDSHVVVKPEASNPGPGPSQEASTVVPPPPGVLSAAAAAVAAPDTAAVPTTAAADGGICAPVPVPIPVPAAATVLAPVAEERSSAAAAVLTDAPAGATAPPGVEDSGGDGGSGGGGAAAATAAPATTGLGRRESMRTSRSALSPAKPKSQGVAGAEPGDGVHMAAVDGGGVAEGPIIAAETVPHLEICGDQELSPISAARTTAAVLCMLYA
ncbi:hypothetical protein VOLCADRAFT_97625 [Volvox carteri f. nagariensis]|uniref:VASt domain-containing protein n=1 Tax=Volvox carteri f. nagariensis TaxID=3068 RepID=D8UD76_VOLCA|nr:uncharacterized protein VOLCADRAFT_97625 [Volvox carteri f. nagariensis]EFJ42345.1 hypothetical protein VOLCADRAFT_97625 [Volvox carteri f. nagariensis]|eukprot:XP_002956578.1 hypothetical protein VOLCADRAFT_97625 [Volvox carteri f. nagariensis]